MSTEHTEKAQSTSWIHVLGAGLGLSVLVAVLVTAFAWPSSELGPRDVPLAVAGPPEAVTQVDERLSTAMPDAFDVQPAADEQAARQLIDDRDVYGAVVLDPQGAPRVLVASAASPAVSRVLQQVADQLGQDGAAPAAAQVEDVAPLPDDDPRGTGFSSAALPMVMGGMAIGYVMSLTVVGIWRRVTGALIGATAGGLTGALVAQPWLGVLDGSYLANAGVLSLAIAAISITIVGLGASLGHAGLGLGALVMLLLGNPLSGTTSAPEMLPSGWGTFGQLLPPGAGGTLLRSTSFFDGAAAGGPLLVLISWVLGGVLLATIAWSVRERTSAGSTSPAAPASSSPAPASRH